MKESKKIKLRKKVYQLLKVNDATNKVSWWNLSDDVVDLIVSERERVIGEMVKLNDKELHCGWKHDISQDSIERKLCNECYAINEFINKLKKI